jgi:parvulin-like peptidyl-prolyl cis-trans isomerase-like protein
VRRLVALFVVALLGAAIYGVSGASSGVSANHQGVSQYTLNAELSAISNNADLACYLSALDPTSYAPGAGNDSVKASAAAVWANLRVEGLAINQYVTATLKYHPDAAELSAAKTSLEDEMTEEAQNSTTKCTGTAAEAVAAMPAEMRTSEIQDQASSLYLVKKLNETVPLTEASMKKYYKSHRTDYDRLCVSIALVTPSAVPAFEKAQAAGASVATLAKKYSQDTTSAANGGAYGCYSPSSQYYTSVRADVAGATFDSFPATPQYTDQNGVEYALFVAVTKESATPFAKAASTVLSDLQNLNAEAADRVKNSLLEHAAVHVDPSFGQWGLNTTGPQVFAPSVPSTTNVSGAGTLTAGASTYQ